MLSEVSILKTLDHPHILKVFEVFVESTAVSIVSELCTGGELFEKITKMKRFSEQLGSTYMQQILSAVAYCHERGIVHRDLKPENLLLENPSPKALLKVIDFGTSSKFDPGIHLHKVLGTPYYIAPEVLSREYDEKCDVWSLGVVLYILLSGSPPFTGSSDREVLRKVHLGYYDFDSKDYLEPTWRNVSNSAKDIIRRMLILDPAKRPSARELLHHQWLKQSDRIHVENHDTELDIMSSLKNFRVTSTQSSDKLRQASLQYIATHFTTMEQTEELRRKFIEMDEDKDGVLSREELVNGYCALGLTETVDIAKIMRDCDSDRSGAIDYAEFITATMNWKQALNDQLIKGAFDAFDVDHSGKIDIQELKLIFGSPGDTDETVWKAIITETDLDGDGEINLDEFKHMLVKRLAPLRRKTIS